ncbi:MAG: hypothetical protein F6K56_34235 [Moorea sp. SIO3G5]|nr:hypothetical protein [Moorena sp. SIO3G5]
MGGTPKTALPPQDRAASLIQKSVAWHRLRRIGPNTLADSYKLIATS